MSSRNAKKLRKEFRKEQADLVKIFAEENARIIKPKPEWVPLSWWIWALGFFIKIRK